jgi:hypothetical protein
MLLKDDLKYSNRLSLVVGSWISVVIKYPIPGVGLVVFGAFVLAAYGRFLVLCQMFWMCWRSPVLVI